ncbi:diphthamide biosynthesis protein 3 [Hypoxylon argillaceum]|nr:diphthamide biosynthesis protein 3 [Hypoxylon argillaceum]KAI1152907.1 diphthamide biosynthesis protein 3 [Nemania diffusa]
MAEEEDIAVYDEVEIEDMTFDETLQIFHYPCPCGDRFEIALADLQDESTDIADNLPPPPPDLHSESAEQSQQQVAVAA